MLSINESLAREFIIEGISDDPQMQILIFLIILLIFIITIGGNMTVLLLICTDHQLYTPMYFFLGNLSVMDMSSSTIALHKIFVHFISHHNAVSSIACMVQLYIFSSLTSDELSILSVMSYDRYMAICDPLYYHMVINPRLCGLLAAVCWVLGFLQSIPIVILLSWYTCYKSNKINHYFCDMLPVKEITCNDTSVLDRYIFIVGFLHVMLGFFLTYIPYALIIACIIKIRSSTGRRRAFYTCSSHLTVVVLLYITLVFQYLGSTAGTIKESNKMFSLCNTAVVPMLNPLIYSLKNKDVKSALQRKLKIPVFADV